MPLGKFTPGARASIPPPLPKKEAAVEPAKAANPNAVDARVRAPSRRPSFHREASEPAPPESPSPARIQPPTLASVEAKPEAKPASRFAAPSASKPAARAPEPAFLDEDDEAQHTLVMREPLELRQARMPRMAPPPPLASETPRFAAPPKTSKWAPSSPGITASPAAAEKIDPKPTTITSRAEKIDSKPSGILSPTATIDPKPSSIVSPPATIDPRLENAVSLSATIDPKAESIVSPTAAIDKPMSGMLSVTATMNPKATSIVSPIANASSPSPGIVSPVATLPPPPSVGRATLPPMPAKPTTSAGHLTTPSVSPSPMASRVTSPLPSSSGGTFTPSPLATLPPPAQPHDPDKLRERVAQLESASAAFRTNTQRTNEQLAESTRRAVEQASKLEALERESAAARAKLEAELEAQRAHAEAALAAQRSELDAELQALRARANESGTEALAKRLDALAQTSESVRTMLQGVRVEVDAHSRAFDARKIRIDSIEHELTVLRGDSHLAELKRAMERMDLRMAALEQEVQGLRTQVSEVLPTVNYERERLRVAEERVSLLDGGKRPSMLPPWFEPLAERTPEVLPTEGVEALERIKGVGPRTARVLVDAGIRTIAEVAAWKDEDLARISTIVGKKPSQITKAGWVASARALIAAQ